MDDIKKIYELYGNQVYRYLICLTKDSMLAEELTQETFYQAIKSIHRFRGECKLSVWLCQIAKYSYYKYSKRYVNEERVEDLSEIMSEQASPENMVEDKYERLSLLKAIHALKQPYKEVVALRIYGDLNFKEIGDIFCNSENWARTTFFRGKLKLKELLTIKEEK